jgi:hypothetical protein
MTKMRFCEMSLYSPKYERTVLAFALLSTGWLRKALGCSNLSA